MQLKIATRIKIVVDCINNNVSFIVFCDVECFVSAFCIKYEVFIKRTACKQTEEGFFFNRGVHSNKSTQITL